MGFLWKAKDELPERGLVCVGKHLARVSACIAPRLVPTLVAANGESGGDEPVAEAIRDLGPLTGPQLREATGLTKKEVDRAVASLHHRLVLTNSHLVSRTARGARSRTTCSRASGSSRSGSRTREAARRDLALLVLQRSGELTAADLGGALGWRRKEAAACSRRSPTAATTRRASASGPPVESAGDDRGAGRGPGRRGHLRGADEAQAAHEVRRAVPRARARRPDRPDRGPRLERRRAARRPLRARATPCACSAEWRSSATGSSSTSVRSKPPTSTRDAHTGDASRPRRARGVPRVPRRRADVPGATETVEAVLARPRPGAHTRRPPRTTTPTPAACSSTRSASRRSAARRRSCIRGCGPTSCSRPRSCTTSAGRSSWAAARRSPSPTRAGCSVTCISACG